MVAGLWSNLNVSVSMSNGELVVWAGMTGAIALLCLVAIADCLAQRTLAAARGLAFLVTMGGSAVVLSGLVEQMMPGLDPAATLPLRAAIGPFSGALALTYLGVWLGAGQDEPLTRWIVLIASLILVVVGCALAVFGGRAGETVTMTASALLTLSMVPVALFVSARGAWLGDALARWMVVACASLGVSVAGLYARSLAVPGLGLPFWSATAFATVAYFLIVIALTIQRNREVRQLRRLANGLSTQSFDIAMPQGSQLLPKVAEAMWRSQRLERPCVVAAIAVRNLYELGDELGHGVEAQILAVLAARIRRHVGFRNVVGLYHPRCFVLAVSPGQDPRRGELLVETLLRSVRERVRVGPPGQRFDFWPSVGMGVVEATQSAGQPPIDALSAINRAEQLALEDQVIDEMLSRPLDLDTLPSAL